MDAFNALDALVAGSVTAHHAAIERACEAALQGGLCGVSVVGDPAHGYTYQVDLRVPYGQVWEAPTDNALELLHMVP